MGLHLACMRGKAAEVRRLIRNGHNVNAYDMFGWTPLHRAAAMGQVKAVKELIRAKADVQLKVKMPSRTPLRIFNRGCLLFLKFMYLIIFKIILDIDIGLDEHDTAMEGRTALMLAVVNRRSAVVAELVKAGADVSLKDKKGMTAVLLAKSYDMVGQLVRDVNDLSREDRSRILWHACDVGRLRMVQSAIEAGCDVDHIHKGQTPVMMATLRGHDSIVKELILANCDVNLYSKRYFSTLASYPERALILLSTAVVWMAVVVAGIGPLMTLMPDTLVPLWIDQLTGSLALLAAPLCAIVGVLCLPLTCPVATLVSLLVGRAVAMMAVVAAVAGPEVWVLAVVMAIVLPWWMWGPKATMAVLVSVFVAIGWALVIKIIAQLLVAACQMAGQDALVTGILVMAGILVIAAVVVLVARGTFKIKCNWRVVVLVGWVSFRAVFTDGPTWPWIKKDAVANYFIDTMMLWLLLCKAPRVTALHYAASYNHIKCGFLLVEAGANMRTKKRCLQTPYEILSKRLVDEVKQTLSFTAKRIVAVIGHTECGKSTLIAALKAENKRWWMKVINRFRKIHIRQRTTGIEVIHFSSQSYSETMFYDFAGQSQYHGPHQSFLEAMLSKPEVSVTLLLLVKATEEEDIITEQLYRWLQPLTQVSSSYTPQLIVVGSFSDQVKLGSSDKKEDFAKLLRCTKSVQDELSLTIQACYLLNCRQPESRGINQIRTIFEEVQIFQLNSKSLSYNLHWVLVQVRKAFSVPAVRLDEFQTWLQDNAKKLPRNLPTPEEVCQDLSAAGHTLFLLNKLDFSQSWLILDVPALLHDVYGTLFSGSQSKVNEFGLLHCSQLNELFPDMDSKIIQGVLISLEFCTQIDPILLRGEVLQCTSDKGREGWLYFPALVSTLPPEAFPEDPDPEQFQWLCWQLRTAKKHFISAHLLQTIILRLAANHVFACKLFPIVTEHGCSVWMNGLSWRSTKDVDIAVQISDSSVVQVVGRSKAGSERLHRYTSTVVQDIAKTIAQLSPKLEATPYFVHPYTPTLWKDPKAAPPDLLYPMSSIFQCMKDGSNRLLPLPLSTSSVPPSQFSGGESTTSPVQDLNYPKVAQSGELGMGRVTVL